MRAIYGEIDKPDSAHILIIRGFKDGYVYWLNHRHLYPNWGCMLFPDKDDTEPLYIKDNDYGSGIHLIFPFSEDYINSEDKDIVDLILHTFPPYDEDSDPICFEHLDEFAFRPYRSILDEVNKNTTDILSALGSIMGDLHKSK